MDLWQRAARAAGIEDREERVKAALNALIRQETTRCFAQIGGSMLGQLPQAMPLETSQLSPFIFSRELFGTGIGMVDAHLLGSASEQRDVRVWAFDQRIAAPAERLGIACRA